MGIDCYQFTGQANHGAVVDRNATLVLDTNVLSTIYSVARGGFDLDRVQDRRAAHLLRWLAARPDVAVTPLFGALEGAGFHAGAVDGLGVIQRFIAALAFATWGREHAERWIASGEPASSEIPVPEYAIHPDGAIELGETLLPWTVLPSYVAALAAVLVEREGREGPEAVEVLHRLLVSRLDYLPAFGWFIGSLMFTGTAKLRSELRRDLFKLGRGELRTQCLSAGWDLGYLQLLSMARIPQIRPVFQDRIPLLVTEDRRLPPTAILLLCQGNSGTFELDGSLLDPRWRDEVLCSLDRLQAQRLAGGADTAMPTWERCATAAQELERELGIEGAPALSLRGEEWDLMIQPEAIEIWLRAAAIEDTTQALQKLLEHAEAGIDLIPSGASALAILLRIHATVHARELCDAWEAMVRSFPTEMADSLSFMITVRLALAIAEEDWSLSSALFKKLALEDNDGVVVLWMRHVARHLLEGIATARHCSLDELVPEIVWWMGSGSAAAATSGNG